MLDVLATAEVWVSPVVTLLAVIVGGVITFFVQDRLARRQETGLARGHARLVQADLYHLARLLKVAGATGRWRGDGEAELTATWEQCRETLARHLSAQEWDSVARVITGLALLKTAPHGNDKSDGADRLVQLIGVAYRELSRVAATTEINDAMLSGPTARD